MRIQSEINHCFVCIIYYTCLNIVRHLICIYIEKPKPLIIYVGYKFHLDQSLIREQLTKHEIKEIDNFDLVKSLSFKYLPKLLSITLLYNIFR